MRFWILAFFVMMLAIGAWVLWLTGRPFDTKQIALIVAVAAFGAPLIWFRHVYMEEIRVRKIEGRKAHKTERQRKRNSEREA